MTTDTTTTPQERTLYGWPPWCDFDHAGEIVMEPGAHKRDLAHLAGPLGDAVDLCVYPAEPLEVTVYLGRNGAEHYPATRETVEHLRDVAGMLREAADELSGMLHAGDLETFTAEDNPA